MKKRWISLLVASSMAFSAVGSFPDRIVTPVVSAAETVADVSALNPLESTYSFIKSLEGCDLQCFWDVRQWTIGWGNKCPYDHASDGTKVGQRGGHTISKEYADELFISKISGYVSTLKSNCEGLSMTQNQFDALLSATYNHGNVIYCPLKYYLQGTLTEAEAREEYYVWCINAGSSTEAGLRRRRKAEADLFFSSPEPVAAPTYFNILTDKPKYEVGESVVFTYDSDNATKYNIGMHKDGIPLDTWDTTDNIFEYKLNEPGSYYVYGSAFNSKGSVENSKPVYFEVVNCEKEPSYFNISTDKNKYMVGEEMQITFESDTAVKYGVGVHLNGEPYDYIDSFNNEEKITLSKAGTYYFYGSAFNSKGYADNSSPVWVNVYDSAPEISKISIDDSELCVGDTITFKVESDTATAYSLGIYKDGERYDSIWDFTEETHEYLLKESGEYSVYVTSYNSLGYKGSEKVKFTVKEKINKGDCNNDGKLSAIDAIALRKYLLGAKDSELANSEAADLDDNGVINIVDFIMLKNLLASS
ncbi:MAG: dockerin type I domain-containing protein [Eubacteriales bacterium]|nr:dockerin type I domain-containing protein [Eubacteriales bacterium]